MIAIALRNYGNIAIVEMAGDLNMPAARLKSWVGMMLKLEKAMVSMGRAITAEKMLIPSAFHPKNMKKGNYLAQAMNNPELQKKYLDPFFNPLIEACDKPYSEAKATFSQKKLEIQKIGDKVMTPGLHHIAHFFAPEDLFMQLMMSIATPNMKSALEQDFRSRQILRGAIAALALRAYQIEHKNMPESLQALETWLGTSLPTDIFSEKPLVYSKNGKKLLSSVGPDEQPDTDDDLVFMPVSENIPEKDR